MEPRTGELSYSSFKKRCYEASISPHKNCIAAACSPLNAAAYSPLDEVMSGRKKQICSVPAFVGLVALATYKYNL